MARAFNLSLFDGKNYNIALCYINVFFLILANVVSDEAER